MQGAQLRNDEGTATNTVDAFHKGVRLKSMAPGIQWHRFSLALLAVTGVIAFSLPISSTETSGLELIDIA